MKYVAPAAAVILAGLSAFAPQIAGLVAAHPNLSMLFGSIGVLAASFAPQPHA